MGRTRKRPAAARALVAGLVLVSAIGCGAGGGASGKTASGGAAQNLPADLYGYGPGPMDPSVTLQPDVVPIKDGPKAIRGASGDGLTWTMDGSAAGVKDLKVGDVMMASSVATGRVAKLDHQGGDVVVTLAPVNLTDVVKDGDLKTGDVPIDLGQSVMMQVPDFPADDPLPPPAASTDSPSGTPTDSATDTPTDTPTDTATDAPTDTPTSTATDTESPEPSDSATDSGSTGRDPGDTGSADTTDSTDSTDAAAAPNIAYAPHAAQVVDLKLPELPMTTLAALGRKNGSLLGPLSNGKAGLQIGNWYFEPYTSTNQVRLRATWTGKEGLKFGFNLVFYFSAPKVSAEEKISNGQVQSSSMAMSGLQQIGVDLGAGTANGLKDNSRYRMEIPIDFLSGKTPLGGTPATLTFKTKFLVEFGFGSKNSTLQASGLWDIQGTVGAGNVVVTEAKSLIGSLTGIGLAGTALVFAFDFKVQVGIGLPLLNAGPYAKLVVSTGFTSSSALNMQPCTAVNVVIRGSGGAAVEANDTVLKWLASKIGSDKVKKIDFEKQLTDNHDLFKKDYFAPNVAMCDPSKS